MDKKHGWSDDWLPTDPPFPPRINPGVQMTKISVSSLFHLGTHIWNDELIYTIILPESAYHNKGDQTGQIR